MWIVSYLQCELVVDEVRVLHELAPAVAQQHLGPQAAAHRSQAVAAVQRLCMHAQVTAL